MERGIIRNNVAAPNMPANTLLIWMVFMMHLLLKPDQPYKVNASEFELAAHELVFLTDYHYLLLLYL